MEKVQKEHELLQTTQAELEAETKEILQVSTRLNDNYLKALKMMWRQLFVIWAVVIVLFIAYFLVIREISTSPKGSVEDLQTATTPLPPSEVTVPGQVPAAQPQPPLPSPPDEEQVTETLRRVREAQLKKDINLFVAAYSPAFPGLEEKKERILRTWENYNYLDMNFTIKHMYQQSANLIVAEVVWDTTIEDLQSKEKGHMVKKFTVHFSNTSGEWLIQKLFEEQKTGLVEKD